MIVASLQRKLPKGFFAELQVHSGQSAEIDVATYEGDLDAMSVAAEGNGGGVATAVWAPPRPTLSVYTDLPAQDVYEVQVYDERRRSIPVLVGSPSRTTNGSWRLGCNRWRSDLRCPPCRCGWPIIWPCHSTSKRATKKAAAF